MHLSVSERISWKKPCIRGRRDPANDLSFFSLVIFPLEDLLICFNINAFKSESSFVILNILFSVTVVFYLIPLVIIGFPILIFIVSNEKSILHIRIIISDIYLNVCFSWNVCHSMVKTKYGITTPITYNELISTSYIGYMI